MTKDSADLHVERWRDHWIMESPFDEEVEAAIVRIIRLNRHLTRTTRKALTDTALQDFEYATLHTLLVRETPGRGSPTELAHELDVSPAGMTGRLDSLEARGFIQRVPATADRRRTDIEVTRSGVKAWRDASRLRGSAEEDLARSLSRDELVTLNNLLRRMLLHVEAGE